MKVVKIIEDNTTKKPLNQNRMTPERIKEIQLETAYPNSVSVQQALLKVWNECEQEKNKKCYHPLTERKYTSDYYFECTICGDNNY